MKRCPTCKRTYEDDTQRFCLEDGSALDLLSETAGPTLVLPTSEPVPTISKVAPPDVPLPRPVQNNRDAGSSEYQIAGSDQQGSNGATAIIGAIMALAVILFLVGLGLWGLVYVRRIPIALFCLIGMIVAMMRARRYRRPALMTGVALGFFMIEGFVNSIVGFSLNKAQLSLRLTALTVTNLYSIVSIVDDFAFAAVIAVLVWAALTARNQEPAIE